MESYIEWDKEPGKVYRVYGIDENNKCIYEHKYLSYDEAKDDLKFRNFYEPENKYYLEEVL